MRELVIELNRIFHDIDAPDYDRHHPEIYVQLPELWEHMLTLVMNSTQAPWRVLDFGAGTGFASVQIARHIPPAALTRLTCIDLSIAMLAQCRVNVAPLVPHAEFAVAIPYELGEYDLLLSNSVLHHLPDIPTTLATLEPILSDSAWWILGHEPSSQFYENAECMAHLTAFRHANRWRKYLQPASYTRRVRRSRTPDPLDRTAREAFLHGLFEKHPPALVIDRLVDFGVAHCPEEVHAGRGLNIRELEAELQGRWKLRFFESYGFMGDIYEGGLSRRWREKCADLKRRYPNAGANFSAVWERVGKSDLILGGGG